LVFGTPRHTVPVPRYHGYFTGILRQGDHNFYCFETPFFSYLIFFFPIVSRCDATKYGSASRAYMFASHQALQLSSHSHSHLTSKNNVSIVLYIKTNQWFLSRLIIHSIKVSYLINLYLLTIYLIQTQMRGCGDQVAGTSTNERVRMSRS
jgi:hypothetical protein